MNLGKPKQPNIPIKVTYHLLPEERKLARRQLEASADNIHIPLASRAIADRLARAFDEPQPKVEIKERPNKLLDLIVAMEADNGLSGEWGYARLIDVLAGNIKHELAKRGLQFDPPANGPATPTVVSEATDPATGGSQ